MFSSHPFNVGAKKKTGNGPAFITPDLAQPLTNPKMHAHRAKSKVIQENNTNFSFRKELLLSF